MSFQQSLLCLRFYSNTYIAERKASKNFEFTDNVGGRYMDLDGNIWPCVLF